MIPIDHDTSQPCFQIPEDTYISDLDPDKIHFLKTIPNVVKKLNAEIDWEHSSETELRILCTLTKGDKDATKDWEDSVKQSISFLFSTITVERRECLKNTWQSVCTKVQKIRKANQTVAVIEKGSEFTLSVVGRAEAVKKIHHQIDSLCKEIEENGECIKYSVKMNDLEKSLLHKVNFTQKLEMKYPKVKVTLTDVGIELNGLATELLVIQTELNAFIRNTRKMTLKLSEGQLKVLTMVQRQPNSKFSKSVQKLTVVLTVEEDTVARFGKDKLTIKGDTVVLFGMDGDVDKCEEIVTSSIIETTVNISKEEQSVFVGKTWEEFSSSLVIRHGGALHLEFLKSRSVVRVAAYAADVNRLLEDMKKYIQQKALKKAFVDIDVPNTRMITQWMKEDLKNVEKDFERYDITITSAEKNCGLIITGTEDGLAPVKIRINRLVSKIVSGSHTVTIPGMPFYFTQEMGKYFIKSQENKHRVIVHPVKPGSHDAPEIPREELKPTTKELQKVTHSSGVVIKVTVGDMTSHLVDVIVNAGNGHLSHLGGLAKGIVDKGKFNLISSLYSESKTVWRWYIYQ